MYPWTRILGPGAHRKHRSRWHRGSLCLHYSNVRVTVHGFESTHTISRAIVSESCVAVSVRSHGCAEPAFVDASHDKSDALQQSDGPLQFESTCLNTILPLGDAWGGAIGRHFVLAF